MKSSCVGTHNILANIELLYKELKNNQFAFQQTISMCLQKVTNMFNFVLFVQQFCRLCIRCKLSNYIYFLRKSARMQSCFFTNFFYFKLDSLVPYDMTIVFLYDVTIKIIVIINSGVTGIFKLRGTRFNNIIIRKFEKFLILL